MGNLREATEPTKAHPHLFRKSVAGGFWVFNLRILTQLVSYFRWIILARVLEVEEMGLLFIGALTIQVLTTLTNTGFRSALIQKKENIEKYLNTVWTVDIIRALVIYLILFFVAPYVSMLKVPAEKVTLTVSLIRVIGLSLLINACANIATIYYIKKLEFYKKFIFDISGSLVDALVTISFAVCYRTVWALVVGKLCGAAVKLVMSYLVFSFRPRLSFDLTDAKYLWGFGKWIFASIIMVFILSEGDDIFVWSYLGVIPLTLYRMAYTFCSFPVTEISELINQVTFPAYSKLQDDMPRLKKAFMKVFQLSIVLSFPIAGLIFIFAHDFVYLFLTDKYAGAIGPMRILAVLGAFKTIKATFGPVFYAVGKPEILTKTNSVKLVVFLVAIYPMTRLWGITGTALNSLLISILSLPFEMCFISKIINCKAKDILSKIASPAVSILIMFAVTALLKKMIFVEIGFPVFFVFVITSLLVYGIAIFTIDWLFKAGLIALIKEHIEIFLKRESLSPEAVVENIQDKST